MNNLIEMTDQISSETNYPSNHPQHALRGLIYGVLIAGVVALSPIACAQLNPAPDGAYPCFNTAEGADALYSVQCGVNVGFDNTAIGTDTLHDNSTAHDNTAVGAGALQSNNGNENTATGAFALGGNTTGTDNTATGFSALGFNGSGVDNTATGVNALGKNGSGNDNTATGFQALLSNTSGPDNTGTGFQALYSNTTGADNTATGFDALETNSTGANNTADGIFSLFGNTTGMNNTAVGSSALSNNSTGSSNVALGFNAGMNLSKGNNNIIIGANVPGNSTDANTIRIGKSGTQQKAFIAGISGKTVASGVGVIINSQGQLGTVQSSARFKDEIKPMDEASEALLKLRPVTFRYKEELDPDKIPQFGLIAEEVEKVNPDLIVRDEEGKISTVRYEAVNAMLLNEFLKAHRKIEEQEATLTRQQQEFRTKFAEQQKQIDSLIAAVQKAARP
jgi:Chaperone of endosialidase